MESTVKRDLLRKIAGALDGNNSPDNSHFFAEDDMPIENIRIEIENVGQLTFPLSDDCIAKLVDISTKARFGSGVQTLLDENVRNTQEIAADKLHISFKQEALDRMMDKLRIVLGLGDNCVLSPHLHNMLIYRTGQFFDMHQDSEKLENMIATLVIVLPNPHIGGDLTIELGKEEHVFSSESIRPINAKCIAFYADCSHKIEKVKEGERIALTYNVVLKAEEPLLPTVNRQLLEAVKEYFDLKEDEQKLVYFLNHSYTEHGLKWNILKGEDSSNCLALRSVAKELALVPHLALVKIRKSYEAESSNDSIDSDHFIVQQVTLSFWVDSDNKKVSFSECNISDKDICLTKDTDLFEPYNKEYEEYTGNAGNTMDYWYRRAAVVLWPESVKYLMSFQLSYDYSLGELCKLCKMPGNQQKVEEIIVQAGNYIYKSNWGFSYYSRSNDINALKLAGIALYIENSDNAFSLLKNLKWEILSNSFIEKLTDLQSKYGVQWCINLLNKLKTNSLNVSLNDIDLLTRSFLEHNCDISIAKWLLDVQHKAIITKEFSLHERIQKLHKFFKACLICEYVSLLSKVILHVISNTQKYPLMSLAELYVEVHDDTQPEKRVHLKKLGNYLTKTIDHKIISRMQTEDWSINVKLPCKCKNCIIINSFLSSKTIKTKRFPFNAKVRTHISCSVRNLGLPVEVVTEGLKTELVLVKSDALQKNIAEELQKLKLWQQKLRDLNE